MCVCVCVLFILPTNLQHFFFFDFFYELRHFGETPIYRPSIVFFSVFVTYGVCTVHTYFTRINRFYYLGIYLLYVASSI